MREISSEDIALLPIPASPSFATRSLPNIVEMARLSVCIASEGFLDVVSILAYICCPKVEYVYMFLVKDGS